MMYLVCLAAVMQGMADLAVARGNNLFLYSAPPPYVEPCACQGKAWNDALEGATHSDNCTLH